MKNNTLLPWTEKYRPSDTNNIIYHKKIINTINNYILANTLPHMLFYGPPGTGKTSTIISIAKQYYGDNIDNMTIVLNASEERGIETVRTRIKQFVITKGVDVNNFKLVILDEIDAMTDDAQAILRKVVEKYVNNVRFCFICNYLKKINPAIQSRCVIFRFNPIPYTIMTDFVVDICFKENITITQNAINLIIKKANGDLRKTLNILQSLHMHNYINNSTVHINEKSVSTILSCPTQKNIVNILNYVQEQPLSNAITYVLNILSKNDISLMELINYTFEYCMNTIINTNNDVISTEYDTTIIKYPIEKLVNIIKSMNIINQNLSNCNTDNIQIVAFVSIFYIKN